MVSNNLLFRIKKIKKNDQNKHTTVNEKEVIEFSFFIL
jgi:hypothetical protein